MPDQPLGLRALPVVQDVHHDTGKSGVTLGAAAEMDDCVDVSDRGERFNDVVRRVSRNFGDQTFPCLGVPLHAHGDRGKLPHRSRLIGQAVSKPVATNPGLCGKRAGRLPHGGIWVAKEWSNERRW